VAARHGPCGVYSASRIQHRRSCSHPNAELPKEPFRKAGIYYDLWPQHKSEIYRDLLLPLINSKRITLPRLDRLINQTCTLERSVKRSGRDEITLPTHGHDDLINAAAGSAAVVLRLAAAAEPLPIVAPIIVRAPMTHNGGLPFVTRDEWSPNW